MRHLRIGTLLLASTAWALAAWAGQSGSGAVVLRPSASVRALERVGDSLWVGTASGLFVYDLRSDRYVDTMLVGSGLPDNSVRAIRAVGDSVLIATDDGLAVHHGASVRMITRFQTSGFDSIPYQRFRSIDVGVDDMLFLGTYGYGLGVIQGDRSRGWTVTREDSLLDNKVYATAQEDSFTIYFATSMGLCAWSDSVWVGFQAGAGIPRGEVRSILPADEGRYYLLVSGHGIFRFDGAFARRITSPDLFPENDISAMATDADGRLWAAGRYGGVAVYSNGHWTKAGEREPAVWARPWICARGDSRGGVFFGADDGVVLVIAEGRMRRIRVPSGTDHATMSRFASSDAGGPVFALGGGEVVRLGRGGERPGVEPLPGTATDIALSPSGGLWAAGRFGVFRLDPHGFTEFETDFAERDPALEALCFDAQGNLWVAARSGRVYRFDGEIWMRLAEADEIGGPVQRLLAGGGGGVWAVTLGVGDARAARYFAGHWTRFGPDVFDRAPLVAAEVAPDGSLVVASAGRLWGIRSGQSTFRVVVEPREDEGEEPPAEISPPRRARISCLAFDTEGMLYVGAGDWIGRVEPGGTRWVSTVEAFSARGVRSLYLDQGTLWAAFHGDGAGLAPVESLW